MIVFRQGATPKQSQRRPKGHYDAEAKPIPVTRRTNQIQSLEFIVLAGTAKESRKARSLARSHVMLGRQNAKLKPERSPEGSSMEVTFSISPNSRVANAHSYLTSIPTSPGSFDPLGQYPVRMKPHYFMLLQHCEYCSCHKLRMKLKLIDLDLTAVTPKSPSEYDWDGSYKLCLEEDSLFHILLLASAAHINLQRGKYDSQDSIFHKFKALRSINEGLKHGRCDDNFIHCICSLALESVSSS